jgi:hypothetical protein
VKNAFAVILFSSLASSPLLAQFDTAVVLGTVRDATGAVASGCDVQLENVQKAVSTASHTDGAGNFQFLDVQVGNYTLRSTCKGFKAAVTDAFPVAVNDRKRVDLTMEVGDIAQTVNVSGAASIVEGESSDRGQIIGREPVVDLPLNGRNYADLRCSFPASANPPWPLRRKRRST